jgi:hypothetical protein
MKKWTVRVLACAALVSGVLTVPTSAGAVTRTWSFQDVTGNATAVQRNGLAVTMSVNCPNGMTPVAGWTIPSVADDVRRNSETMGLGSGTGYSVKVDDETAGSETITVTPHVRCVSMNNFTAGTTIKTPVQIFQVDDTSQLAEGEATCPAGYQVISGSVTFGGSGGVALLTTAPSLGPGWEARGWHSNDLGTMSVTANCVLASDIPGATMKGNSEEISWGSTSSASCPSGTTVLTAGTYQIVGDGQAITINQQLTGSGSGAGWSSTSLGSGWMQTRVLCVPTASPSVVVSGPSGYVNSNSVSWSFTATDPAAGGGYSMSTTCTVYHPSQTDGPYGCSSPVNLSGLSEGTHQLSVVATTSDGRTGSGGISVVVDTIVPLVTFDDPAQTAHRTADPVIGFSVADANPVGSLSCWVDAAAPGPCGDPLGDYRGPRAVSLSGLAEGAHVLHVQPTDAATNTQTYNLPFKVDTVAPSVQQTAPTVPFTLATSTLVKWTGTDAVSGIAEYGVRWQKAPYNANFGAWSTPVVSAASATSRSFGSLARGATYCYGVDATDHAGNVSPWTAGRCTAIPLDDRDLARSAGWTPLKPSGYYSGTALSSTKLGSTLSVVGAKVKRIAVVAKKCPTCGIVGVYVGSKLISKVNLKAGATSRAVIVLPSFALRTGTVKLKVLSSGKLVQIDALGLSSV